MPAPEPGTGTGSGSGSGSLPGPVLFEPGLMGMGYSGSYPLRYPDPNRLSATADRKPPRTVGRFLFETNRCNRSVGFGWFYPSRSAINSALFLSNKKHRNKKKYRKGKRVPSSAFLSENSATRVRSDIQQEVGILQRGFRSNFQQILKIRSERRLRKFNRFFNRIVV